MLEKLYFLPSSLLPQTRHLRIHLAYLHLDATPKHRSCWTTAILINLTSIDSLRHFSYSQTCVLKHSLCWDGNSNLWRTWTISLYPFKMTATGKNFASLPHGVNELFKCRSDISDRSPKNESALPRFESLTSRWTEHLQRRGMKVNIHHSSVVDPQKRRIYDQLSGMRVNFMASPIQRHSEGMT